MCTSEGYIIGDWAIVFSSNKAGTFHSAAVPVSTTHDQTLGYRHGISSCVFYSCTFYPSPRSGIQSVEKIGLD